MQTLTMDSLGMKARPFTEQGIYLPETIMETVDLSVSYGEKKALDTINLAFPRNTVTALIGPSGCGKSTFLRCLNRMNDGIGNCAVDGEILYEGTDILSPRINVFELRKQIGMVFQRPNPFAKSIFKNVASGPLRQGVKNKAELGQLVETCLRKAALWDEVKDQLHGSALRLSGGQQQRLCIARSLAMKPDILLLDEPASALDPVSTGKIEELIGELKRDYTMIMVTHNMQQAARISDRTAFFYMGEVVEQGDTWQIFNEPGRQKTREYVTGQIG